ncbi:MAG: glycerophosphodiester phosphodiesterase family protein [Eubacterium sp.]
MKKTAEKHMRILTAALLATSVTAGMIHAEPAQAAGKSPLNRTGMTLVKGQKYQLKFTNAKKYSRKKISWSTSNKKIAAVSKNGTVRGASKGKAVITAKIGKKQYRCTVSVQQPVLSAKTMTLGYKGTGTLALKGTGKKVTWHSSSAKVAAVSSRGKVTAGRQGTAVITAKAGGQSYRCKVTVSWKYRIRYEGGGAESGSVPDGTAVYGKKYKLAKSGFLRAGYELAGWRVKGKTYKPGASVSDLAKKGTVRMTAVWKKKKGLGLFDTGRLDEKGVYRSSTWHAAMIQTEAPSSPVYYSLDDFVSYEFAYCTYRKNGTFVSRSKWQKHGVILNAGYKYRFYVRRRDKAKLSSTKIRQISGLFRKEKPEKRSSAAEKWIPLADDFGLADESQTGTANEGQTGSSEGTADEGQTGNSEENSDETSEANPNDQLYIAHRGLSAEYPENTVLAFEEAGKAGFWGVETDLYSTKDGKLVCMHDATVNRTTDGTGKVMDMTKKQIDALRIPYTDLNGVKQELKVPSFEEYLSVCKAYHVVAVLEIKQVSSEAMLKKIVDTIKAYGMEEQCMIISFETGYLENIKNTVDPDIGVLFLYNQTLDSADYTYLSLFTDAGVSQNASCFTEKTEGELEKRKLIYCIYTVKTQKQYQKYSETGLDMLTMNEKLFS